MTPAEFKSARNALGLSLSQLARLLGVNARTVRKWEADPSIPSSRPPNPTAVRVLKWLASGELKLRSDIQSISAKRAAAMQRLAER